MTRKKQINKAAEHFLADRPKEYFHTKSEENTYHTGFVMGAKWADEHPKNPWISVEDRLPEEDKIVIFMGNNGALYLGHHYLQTDYGRTWFADGGYAMKDDEVTHWMPIPQIEKGE